MGRLIEGLSRSTFWKAMAVFAIEDDPQAGFDHVTGYRTTAYLAGPFVKRGAVVSTQYNTTSLLRTMEQILGLPPMNQFDASAVPMSTTAITGLFTMWRGASFRNASRTEDLSAAASTSAGWPRCVFAS